jgi:hypothetical protein
MVEEVLDLPLGFLSSYTQPGADAARNSGTVTGFLQGVLQRLGAA